jgi:alpha-methylacyl-CoA racemase
MATGNGPHSGPLEGVRILDLSGLGPAPFATMMLADFGARVLSVRRPDPLPFDPASAMSRGKDVMGLDLRSPDGQALARRLSATADVLIEGFRPGVMERLGLGPDVLLEANPRLVYARLTGWGQTGPFARKVGHDINYLAVSGTLAQIGHERPVAPPAFLGDLANGSYLMVIGVMMALFERHRTGRGQVVDAAIVDGAAYMLGGMFGELELGLWDGKIDNSILGGTAPFYGIYECSDGRFYSVGAIEPKFYATLLDTLGLSDVSPSPEAQMDRSAWPELRERIAAIFLTRTQAEWNEILGTLEVCAEPVLGLDEIQDHPHLQARGTVKQGAAGARAVVPAPRLSGHPERIETLNPRHPRPVESVLAEAGLSAHEIAELIEQKIIWTP